MEVTEAFRKQKRSEAQVGAAAKKAAADALALAKRVGEKSDEGRALSALAASTLSSKEGLPEALRTARRALNAQREQKDKAAEANALSLVANTYIVGGSLRDALRAAKEALAIYRELGDKAGQATILETIIGANFQKGDADDALRAAKELAALSKASGNKAAEASALERAAAAMLANEEFPQALKAAEEALSAAKGAQNEDAQLAAMATIYDAHRAVGKPVSALSAAQELLAAAKKSGRKRDSAEALLLVADAQAGNKEAVGSAREAVGVFREIQDKAGEAAALVTAASALLSQEQKQFDEGLKAAREGLALFRELGEKLGQAIALSTAAAAHLLKKDGQEAERAAKEAYDLFSDVGDAAGQAYSQGLVSSAQRCGSEETATRVLFDDDGVAHVELNELASQQSLEAAIDTLLTAGSRGRPTRCVVLHLEGSPGQAGPQSYAVSVGAFIIGLRTVGLPVICACWGKIAGPSWGLVLASDYRIAATSASFTLPLWGPPETLGELVGYNAATALCMASGPASALTMLEKGIIHQLQKGQDDTRRAAGEMAKRISAFPAMASRQNLALLSPAVEKYALAAARGAVRA